MLRNTRRFLRFGHGNYGSTSSSELGYTGGLGHFGNLYQGRVNPDDHQPRGHQKKVPRNLYDYIPVYADEDPVIKQKLEKCPYFALADMCVWQGMAPTYLDPGLITKEEHHLLLLFSRAYYEKWREIHSKPREFAPRARKKLGAFDKCAQVFEYCRIPLEKIRDAQKLYFDDASLIALHPRLWITAHLEDSLRDQLTGRVLRQAGFIDDEVEKVFRLIESMRTLIVKRNDLPGNDELLVEFKDAVTLHDLYHYLDIGPDRSLRCQNYVVEGMPKRCITVGTEDDYFDFLVDLFYNSNPEIANTNSAARYVLTVDERTREEQYYGDRVAV